MPHLLNVDPRGFIWEFYGYFYLQAFSINDVVFILHFYSLYYKKCPSWTVFHPAFGVSFPYLKNFQAKMVHIWITLFYKTSFWFVTKNLSEQYRKLRLIKDEINRQRITHTIKQILHFLRWRIFCMIHLTYWKAFTKERLYLKWCSRYWEAFEAGLARFKPWFKPTEKKHMYGLFDFFSGKTKKQGFFIKNWKKKTCFFRFLLVLTVFFMVLCFFFIVLIGFYWFYYVSDKYKSIIHQ